MAPKDLSLPIYEEGIYTIVTDYESRRQHFKNCLTYLPDVDADLEKIKSEVVTAPKARRTKNSDQSIAGKLAELEAEFAGQSRLLVVHGLIVAMLRRQKPPAEAKTLFQRLWNEQGGYLASELDTRWRVSAATTFAEHGETLDQRSVGMGLYVLFDSMKLHDCERRRSGQPGRTPFPFLPSSKRFPLPLGMRSYSLKNGDLDRNMLARLWRQAEADYTIFPLAQAMIFGILSDQKSIFARIQRLRLRGS